ncbi:LysR family transcriptional regulator [Enterococcus bulliens]
MELNDIKMFYEVAQTNSVSQAAQNLGYTQSNISKRIKCLEEEIDQRLFERNNKGMHLTSAGQEFIPYAQKLITAYLEIEEHFLKLPLKTLLGATQTITHSYLEKLFVDPTYTIFTAPISTLTTRLLAGTLDFILINQPLTDPAVKLIQTWEEALCFTQSQTADGLFHERTFIVNREPTCPYRKAILEYIT